MVIGSCTEAPGSSVGNPVVCDGVEAAYHEVKRRLGLKDIATACRKRVGIGGLDSDGLPVDLYRHAGISLYVSPYGPTHRAKALKLRADISGEMRDLAGPGATLEQQLDAAARAYGFDGAVPTDDLPPGVVVATRPLPWSPARRVMFALSIGLLVGGVVLIAIDHWTGN